MAIKILNSEYSHELVYLIFRMVFLLWNASFKYLARCNWEVGLLFDMIETNSSKFLHTSNLINKLASYMWPTRHSRTNIEHLCKPWSNNNMKKTRPVKYMKPEMPTQLNCNIAIVIVFICILKATGPTYM